MTLLPLLLQTLFDPLELIPNVHIIVLNVFCVRDLLIWAPPGNTSVFYATCNQFCSLLCLVEHNFYRQFTFSNT